MYVSVRLRISAHGASMLELTPLRELDELNREFGLSTHDLARMLDVDPRTVDRWLSGQSYPQHEKRRRRATLLGLYRRIRYTFTTAEAARLWAHTPHRYLGWLSPVETLRAGRFDRVEGALEVLDSGIAI